MDDTNSKAFNQNAYMAQWKKENMKSVHACFKNDFVDAFKASCKKLGIKQSEVFRKAMQETINEAEKH